MHISLLRTLASRRLVAFVAVATLFPAPVVPADTGARQTISVTTTADSGPGSLRQAILDANAAAGPDSIAFAIPGSGVRTIAPTSPLPTITGPVTIDATTQPGFSGQPIVELSGASAGTRANGLTVDATDTVIRGFVVNRFAEAGIAVLKNGRCRIEGNYIGTNAAGTGAAGNRNGILLDESTGNVVGGTDTAARNVISGNVGQSGIEIAGPFNDYAPHPANVIQGNFFGTDATGTAPIPNYHAVFLYATYNVRIGGAETGAGNVICASSHSGILASQSRDISIKGNRIGTDLSGTLSMGNTYGIELYYAYPTTIGGLEPGAGNVIAHNLLPGVIADHGHQVAILSNSIYDNDHTGEFGNGAAIYFESYGIINPPILTFVGSVQGGTLVSGGLSSQYAGDTVRLEFFKNDGCTSAGYGEAKTFVGSTSVLVDANDSATFSVTLPVTLAAGESITATATGIAGTTTSRVSNCLTDTGGCVLPFVLDGGPALADISSGQTATISVRASGSEPFAYQWSRQEPSGTFFPISGANSLAYTTPALTSTTRYRVRVSNACGEAYGYTTVYVCSAPPAISVQPRSQTVSVNAIYNEVRVYPAANNFYGRLRYQWYQGTSGDTSIPIARATESLYRTPNLTEITSYWVRISNACGTIDSDTATLYPVGSAGGSTVAVSLPGSAAWFLRDTNQSGPADRVFGYGPSNLSWMPLAGDWNGDGVDTPGLYDPSTGFFFLKNGNFAGPADVVFGFGPAGLGWVPLAGDWDGDGKDTPGLYDPSTGFFFLKNANEAGSADLVFGFGPGGQGFVPVAGDWDGDGTDSVGIYAPSTGFFFLKNANEAGSADLVFGYGAGGAGLRPLVGDYDGDGTDTVGLYAPSTGFFFLKNANASGSADFVFGYGPPNATPLVGDWNGF